MYRAGKLYEGDTFLYGGNVVWFTPFKKDLLSYINNHGKGSVDNFFIVSVVDLEINKPLDIRWYSSTFCGWNIIADIISTNGYGAGYINPKAPERTMGKVLTLVARWDITHYAQVKGYDSLIMRDYPGTNSSMKGESYVVFSSSQITNPRTIKVSLSKKIAGKDKYYENAEKDFGNRMEKMLSEDFGILSPKVDVTFYEEEHNYCPLNFDIEYNNGRWEVGIFDCENEEPSLFWETMREEIEDEIKRKDIKKIASIEAENDYDSCDYFRGIRMDEALEACKVGHLIRYSVEAMSIDWEVIEYVLGRDVTEKQVDRFIKNTVPWKNKHKGVNFTTDSSNSEGFGEISVGVDIVGNVAEFGDTYAMAEKPENCIVIALKYNNEYYKPKEFLNKFNNMEKKSISFPVRKNLDYQMELGIEEEKEHKDTYNDVVNDVENDGVIDMTFEEFTSDIASDHLEEDEQYYTKLKKVMNTKNEKTIKQEVEDINKQTQEIKKIREEMEEEFDEWHKEDSEKLKNKAMVQNIKDGIEDIRNEYKKIMAEVVDEVPETEEVTEVIGDEANVSMEPSIETVVDTMEPVQEEITPTNTFYNICSEQGASQIYSQLLEQFKANFPTALTYKNIFQTASGAGLVESMDRYELISIMNMVAQEVSLPRIDFAGYFQPEDELIERGDIRGHENSITYNNDDVDVNEVMSEYDNESPSLFSIDRILDERLKMMNWNVGDVVEQSKAMLRDKLKGIKKNAMISKYLLLDVKANKISTNGNMIDGIVKYQVRLQTLAGNRNRRVTKDIEIPIEIRGEKIVHPREFVYKGENMPLSTYFLNEVMEK